MGRRRLIILSILMVTSTAHAEFKIANDALGVEDKFSQSPGRTYLTAGCIPQKVPMPKGFPGARWVRCNDFKYAKKTMTETKFFSCHDLLPNAVISKITIDRHRAKKWSSMQFSCRQVDQDGTLTGPEKQTPPLFTYRKPGKRTHLRFKSNMLPIGLVEIAPLMQFKETMWAFGLNHRPAHDIVQSGRTGRLGRNYFVGNIGPKPFPRLTTSYDWNCPPGMVLTGLALGHIPNKRKKFTTPIYIHAECRALIGPNSVPVPAKLRKSWWYKLAEKNAIKRAAPKQKPRSSKTKR